MSFIAVPPEAEDERVERRRGTEPRGPPDWSDLASRVRGARRVRARHPSRAHTRHPRPGCLRPGDCGRPAGLLFAGCLFARTQPTPRINELHELAPYLVAIRSYPPLTREAERALAFRCRAGDRDARQVLIRHNLALVVAVARKHRRGGMRLEDLVQEGNLGLMRAVEKFDPRVGTRFSTYATWWIRAYVGRHLEQAGASVRPSAGSPAPFVCSLDEPVGDEDGSPTCLDRVEDGRPSPEDAVLTSAHGRDVRALLSGIRERLGPVAWDIVHSRLSRDPPDTLAEIGARWSLSRERVRQVEVETRKFLERRLKRVAELDPLCDAA